MVTPQLPRDTETYARGLALFERLHGRQSGADLAANRDELCPDFLTMTMTWAFAGVLDRPGLDLVTREFVIIACCVARGYLPQLRAHIEAALVAGATREQIVEVIVQTQFYASGAAANNALGVAAEVFGMQP